jgi:hypothetical protein
MKPLDILLTPVAMAIVMGYGFVLGVVFDHFIMHRIFDPWWQRKIDGWFDRPAKEPK